MKKYFFYSLLFLLCGCNKTEGLDSNVSKDKEKTITTAVIEINGKQTSVNVQEGTIITFTDDYMVIKTNGTDIVLPLNEISNFTYQSK